jgi:signal transduction histidine kinase
MQKLSENISIILGASLLLLLITLFIVLMIVAYLRRDLKHLKEKESMEADFERQLLRSQLETQEETLNQLSTEIHDNVGQLLNSTKLLIGLTQRALPESPETLTMADDTLAKAIQEIRTLSKALNREWLEQFNFIENLETEINRINTGGALTIELFHPGRLPMEANKQIILFRIVQEVLQNALKHAQASRIIIEVKENNHTLVIAVTDNGKGFDEATITKSVGILNIRHRAQLLGGEAAWLSAPGQGTRVHIQLPIKPDTI